jgi:hypothetical protein
MSQRVLLELSPEQAEATRKAVDLYARLMAGQFGSLAWMISNGEIPRFIPLSDDRRSIASLDDIEKVHTLLEGIGVTLGYSLSANYSLGHDHVLEDARRAYEVQDVLRTALFQIRWPERNAPASGHRYSNDPHPPTARVVQADALDLVQP